MASADHHALLSIPQSLVRCRGAALPHPVFDPNPGLTIALYSLWGAMRPLLTLSGSSGSPGIKSNQGMTAGQFFESIKEPLVFPSFNFFILFLKDLSF
jgi:hypothetical protein